MSLEDWTSQRNTGRAYADKYVRYALGGRNVMGLVLLDPQHTALTDDKTRLKEGTVSDARRCEYSATRAGRWELLMSHTL